MLLSDSIRLVLGQVEEPLSQEEEETYGTRYTILSVLSRGKHTTAASLAKHLNLHKNKTLWHLEYLEARELAESYGDVIEFLKEWRISEKGKEVLE